MYHTFYNGNFTGKNQLTLWLGSTQSVPKRTWVPVQVKFHSFLLPVTFVAQCGTALSLRHRVLLRVLVDL